MEGLLTVFVGLTAAAVILQAVILLRMYVMTRRISGEVESTLGLVKELVPTLRVVSENLRTVSDDVVEISSTAREQFHRVDGMVAETGRSLQAQLDKVDRMTREVSQRIHETVDVVQASIVKPVREVGALAKGVTRGVEILLGRKDRHSVDRVHQDEELFI